jgi:hypothetical protein
MRRWVLFTGCSMALALPMTTWIVIGSRSVTPNSHLTDQRLEHLGRALTLKALVDHGCFPLDSEWKAKITPYMPEHSRFSVDAWGRPLLYVGVPALSPGAVVLISLGQDGAVGGDGEDADIIHRVEGTGCRYAPWS